MSVEILSLYEGVKLSNTKGELSSCDCDCQDCHTDSDHNCYNPI